MLEGIVFRSTGSWYEVKDLVQGRMHSCRLKGKFKIKNLKVTNPIAVGDKVLFDPEEARIEDILPRENYVIRQSVHKSAHAHLLAANVDQLVLIATLKSPRTSLGFIDRFLVTAETFRIPAILVFNKIDLYNTEELEYLEQVGEMYTDLGYGFATTSALEGKGIEELRETLKGKTTLISGHSGVGKSTLMNTLLPELELATSEISDFSDKGVHTTTFAEMFEPEEGTRIIDSPGIKELGLIDIEKEELAHYFPEFRRLMGQCKFHNCLHINEPKCAVKQGVEDGELYISRYNSYLSMFENDDNRR
ncbi:ribosome small subunit-dependent GTPase A [Leadbetterella byssophila DSM 17132]|uniref:Small ribosomal subunit biogenesis GTPase RsgA n=1 Tax=Leadbetterella byssophila (strain DSM 17132 / JCM 16389 / KACC 11308 / NBRC 106382 / 4M15) TaxID=649349 RepID=E4RYW4_LEAB4|nr:ribosome small subunit-dependent GTPase A [Leadbetterella byssophila]ADQ17361.1 ribosome small subunit-dependent GTPase A [Leadbetterella byssophila DSM 17132]